MVEGSIRRAGRCVVAGALHRATSAALTAVIRTVVSSGTYTA
ncbi:hypothetical protein JAB8_39310 [Janthinobacterium sp. HH106]|nr:hypothetical protein JAB8_39310 [Janthinobacterium sp. HH106]